LGSLRLASLIFFCRLWTMLLAEELELYSCWIFSFVNGLNLLLSFLLGYETSARSSFIFLTLADRDWLVVDRRASPSPSLLYSWLKLRMKESHTDSFSFGERLKRWLAPVLTPYRSSLCLSCDGLCMSCLSWGLM